MCYSAGEMLVAALLLSVLVELTLYQVPGLWKFRRALVIMPLFLTVVAGVGLLWSGTFLAVLTAVVAGFRVLNDLRLVKARMHERYLWFATRRTAYTLAMVQLLVLLMSYATLPSSSTLFWVLGGVQVIAATVMLAGTIRSLVKTKYRPLDHHTADRELPTVTVAIPARNETANLEACLHSILANDYPKLEIVVLDDDSHDATPDIIKSFAQDGVRFTKGQQFDARWLAKNQAYDQLADEANGELLLFCGVDVRLGPQTIRSLVALAQSRNKQMVSVMPRRLTSELSGTLIQSMRYWWELVPPRRLFNKPAVLSTCWLIDREQYRRLGGMEAVRRAIIPERYFARELAKTDQYGFVRANDILDVQTRKNWRDQYDTAIRTRYPQLQHRPEWALLMTLVQAALLLGPFAVVLASWWSGKVGGAVILSALAALCLVTIHVLIVRVTDPANVLLAAVDFPVAALCEITLGYISMFRYEFSAVEWKGRNVAAPVMHVYPSLPPGA